MSTFITTVHVSKTLIHMPLLLKKKKKKKASTVDSNWLSSSCTLVLHSLGKRWKQVEIQLLQMATYSDSPWGKRTNSRDNPNSCKWKYFTNGLLSNRTENAHGLRGRKQRRKNVTAPTHACSLSLSLSHTHTRARTHARTHTHNLSLWSAAMVSKLVQFIVYALHWLIHIWEYMKNDLHSQWKRRLLSVQ